MQGLKYNEPKDISEKNIADFIEKYYNQFKDSATGFSTLSGQVQLSVPEDFVDQMQEFERFHSFYYSDSIPLVNNEIGFFDGALVKYSDCLYKEITVEQVDWD